MRHPNILLFVFSFLALSPLYAQAGQAGSPPPAQAAPPANAPRAGAAQNPGSPQAGAREEKGDSVVEEATGTIARGPVAKGNFRYVFNVPVRIDHAVTENTEYLVMCGVYKESEAQVGRPVGVRVSYPGVLSNEFSATVPVNNSGNFNGTVEVLVEYPNPIYTPRAWKYMCRLTSRIRGGDGASYGIGLAPYTERPIGNPPSVGVVSSICNGRYSNGRGEPLNRDGYGTMPLLNSRCVGHVENNL